MKTAWHSQLVRIRIILTRTNWQEKSSPADDRRQPITKASGVRGGPPPMGKPDKKAVKSPRCRRRPLSTAILSGAASDYAVAHHIPKRLDVFRKNIPHLIDAEPGRKGCPRMDGMHPERHFGPNVPEHRKRPPAVEPARHQHDGTGMRGFQRPFGQNGVFIRAAGLAASGTPAMPSRRAISPPSPEPVTKTFGATPR